MATRFMVIADSHGDMVDEQAARRAREFVADYKPDIRVHLGDAWDLRSMRAGATDDEKNLGDLNADIEAGLELFGWYRPTHFLWGNHEKRIENASRGYGNSAVVAAYVVDKVADALEACETRRYCKRTGVLTIGDTRLLHGYRHGETAPKWHAAQYGKSLIGHIHRVEMSTFPRVEGTARCWSIGCLCRLDMPYNEAHAGTLSQAHGFAYGEIKNGRLLINQAYSEAGDWNV